MSEIFYLLGAGLAQSFEPLNLFMIFAGCLAGLFIGAMPGLGSVNGVAILLPVTFLVPPTAAIIFLAALYYGAMYGGAISSITLGIPGASAAVATVFDGRPIADERRTQGIQLVQQHAQRIDIRALVDRSPPVHLLRRHILRRPQYSARSGQTC